MVCPCKPWFLRRFWTESNFH